MAPSFILGWLQPISCLVNSFRLSWFHPIFLVGGIGKKGQMVYLTPFATVLMGPTVSVTPYLLPHHRIRAPPRALPPPPPAPPAIRRRRGRPRLRPRPRAPLAEPAADLRRPGPRPRALLADPAPTSAAPARGRAGQAVRRPGRRGGRGSASTVG